MVARTRWRCRGFNYTQYHQSRAAHPNTRGSQSSQFHRADVQLDKNQGGRAPSETTDRPQRTPSEGITGGCSDVATERKQAQGEWSANFVTHVMKTNRHFLGTKALLHLFNTNSPFFGVEIRVEAVLPGERQVVRYEHLGGRRSSRKTGQALEGITYLHPCSAICVQHLCHRLSTLREIISDQCNPPSAS